VEYGYLPFIAIDCDGVAIHWQVELTHLIPFTHNGASYFLMLTEHPGVNHMAFVVKPLPQSQYELTCVI
jgi:hypothetical protein